MPNQAKFNKLHGELYGLLSPLLGDSKETRQFTMHATFMVFQHKDPIRGKSEERNDMAVTLLKKVSDDLGRIGELLATPANIRGDINSSMVDILRGTLERHTFIGPTNGDRAPLLPWFENMVLGMAQLRQSLESNVFNGEQTRARLRNKKGRPKNKDRDSTIDLLILNYADTFKRWPSAYIDGPDFKAFELILLKAGVALQDFRKVYESRLSAQKKGAQQYKGPLDLFPAVSHRRKK